MLKSMGDDKDVMHFADTSTFIKNDSFLSSLNSPTNNRIASASQADAEFIGGLPRLYKFCTTSCRPGFSSLIK